MYDHTRNILFIVLYVLLHYVKSEEVCPHNFLPNDDSNLVNRFNKLRKAVENWLFLQYFHGDKYTSHCDGKPRQSRFMIRCEDHGKKPALKVIREARYITGEKHKDTPCYYLFEYNHPVVCTEKSHKKINTGMIILIVLCSLAAAYLIFGFIYLRFVKHAKVFDLIPNFRKVWNSCSGCCDHICRCGNKSSTDDGMEEALDIDSDDIKA